MKVHCEEKERKKNMGQTIEPWILTILEGPAQEKVYMKDIESCPRVNKTKREHYTI